MVPVLKWAGGKRWLVQRYSNLFPSSFKRYHAPFLGSGAVFFYLAPRKAVLADINSELIATYAAIRDQPLEVLGLLVEHHARHSKRHYYQVRAKQFNVPMGTKSQVSFPEDEFLAVSDRLKGAKLVVSDFATTIGRANEGDFVFVDPPYAASHAQNGFLKYNERMFSWSDQEREIRRTAF